jgi:DNA polymerase III epsilon subunit-like protein
VASDKPKKPRTFYNPEVICIFDFETGGLDPEQGAEPIELAAILLDYHTLQEIGRFPARLMRVQKPENLHPKALSVNGKTVEQVMAAEDPAVVFRDFFNWVLRATRGRGRVLPGGHNVKFDIKFMKWAFKQYVPLLPATPGWDEEENGLEDRDPYNRIFDYHDICSFNVFYFFKVMTKQARYGNLVNATKHYGLPHAAHEAMGDVEASVEVLRILRREALQGEAGVKLAKYLQEHYGIGSDFANTDPDLYDLLQGALGLNHTNPNPKAAAMEMSTTVGSS